MKCLHCEQEFKVESKGSGGKNRTFCFDCMPDGLLRKERNSLRLKLIRSKINSIKASKGCSVCGYKKNTSALEWHHPNADKEFHPGNLGVSYKRTMDEINKCILLCANCHRELHHPESNISA